MSDQGKRSNLPREPWRPSARQARAEGLKRRYYPAWLRDFVDYDYDEALSAEERAWLGAFTEEHYRGYRLKSEEQVTELQHLREAGARKERLRRGGGCGSVGSLDELGAVERERVELQRTAVADGLNVEELRGRNVVEDAIVAALDQRLLVRRAVDRAAAAVGPSMMRRGARAAAAQEFKRWDTAPLTGPAVTLPASTLPTEGCTAAADLRLLAQLLQEALRLPAELRWRLAAQLAA